MMLIPLLDESTMSWTKKPANVTFTDEGNDFPRERAAEPRLLEEGSRCMTTESTTVVHHNKPGFAGA